MAESRKQIVYCLGMGLMYQLMMQTLEVVRGLHCQNEQLRHCLKSLLRRVLRGILVSLMGLAPCALHPVHLQRCQVARGHLPGHRRRVNKSAVTSFAHRLQCGSLQGHASHCMWAAHRPS